MKRKIFLLLFGLPFLGVGIWMAYSIGADLTDAWQMRTWVPVEARLVRAGYATHSGDDADTYEAFAEFSYVVDGVTYTNDRVAISGGADNVGDYQRDLGRRLRRALEQHETIVAYTDPANPADSVIDRNPRWGLLGFKSIFLIVFGGAGCVVLVIARRVRPPKDASAPEYRDRPWLANDAWQSASIGSGSHAAMYFSWGFATLWNLVSAPLPFLMYDELTEKHNFVALIGLLFPFIGIALLAWALRRTLEWRRFGAAPVALDPYPGAIGGDVGGTVDLGLPFDPGARFTMTLTKVHSYVTGSGKNRSRQERARWQDIQPAYAVPGPRGTRLSFRFDVPEGLAESDALRQTKAYDLWRLNLSADLPGPDLDRDYDIPVYATGERSRHLPRHSIDAGRMERDRRNDQEVRNLVSLSYGAGTKKMLYPVGRNLVPGTSSVLFGAVFAVIGWFLIARVNHPVMGGVFGSVGIPVAIFGLYAMLNSLAIVQDGDSITTVRRVLGVPVLQRRMRCADFASFDKKSSMQTQSGGEYVMYYTVFAVDRQGRRMRVGEGFRGASQADAAIRMLAKEFGLRTADVRAPVAATIDERDPLAADTRARRGARA